MYRTGRHTNLLMALTLSMLMAVCASCGTSRRATSSTRPRGTASEVIDVAYTNDIGKRLVKEARRWLGSPYRYGGNTRKGVDCSGLVAQVYDRTLGIKLPRTSADQCVFSTGIEKKKLRNGDLIFFATGQAGRVSHVGIYIGDNRMIHASASRGVVVSDIGESYWLRRYVASGRILRDASKSGRDKRNRGSKVFDPIYDAPPAPDPSPAPDYNILDEILTQKLDSVNSSFFD